MSEQATQKTNDAPKADPQNDAWKKKVQCECAGSRDPAHIGKILVR